MASKKEKFEEWKKGKDYIMWSRLKDICESLDLTSSNFIGYEDLGGLYWEPLLELIYKYGNILKKTYKLKEIKMDYIRPLNYLGAQSDIEVVFDNDRYLIENIKLILYPLRMLRKSAYRLFSVEKLEQQYQDLMTFVDKNDIKIFVEGVKQHMETELYRQNRNCDVNEIDKYYERVLNEDSYKYKFNDKIHEEEKKVEKDDKGNPKEDPKKISPKNLTIEEIERLKNDEEQKKLLLINIKKIEQDIPNIFVKKALQQDLEKGFDLMYKFLNKKLVKDYPFPIDTHKMFVNLYKIPNGREIPQIEYYLGQLNKFIEQLKVMSYEMKLNGLSRTLIPIQKNTEYIEVLKKIYDMHNIIDRILGDKLLYEQYLFIYDMIKFLHDSVMKEDLEVYKNKKFMEKNVPKYIFYMSLIKSSNVFIKFQKNSRKDGGHFTLDQYYQPLKHEIDGPNNIALYAYEHNVEIKKGISDNYKDTEKLLWDEIDKFGRFWLMEGYFPPEDRDKWLNAIESLSNINRLVQEDIRDMILTGNDEKFKASSLNEKENNNQYLSRNNFIGDKLTNSNKILNTENSISDTSMNILSNERKTIKKSTRSQMKKRNSSKKGTNISKHSGQRDKEKKPTRKESLDSSDRIIASLPTNKNGLRPPFVWNFPIEKIEEIREKTKREKERIEEVHKNKSKRLTKKQPKPKLDIVFKEETKKNEIRKVNAYNYYHDGRIIKFMNLFDEIYNNCMKYAKTKGNTWEYVYCKILQVFGIEYVFSQLKEENNEENENNEQSKKEENKEKEKKEEKKEEEKNEENTEKKEEEKNNEEAKNNEEEKNNEDNTEVIIINNDEQNIEGNNNENVNAN